MSNHQEVIGLLPAAGQAKRIAPLPGSKELYPIGFRFIDEAKSIRPKVVCHYLLEKMRLAGITKAYIILRSGKWDIPAYFGDGAMLDINLGYLMMRLPFGVPYTLDQAYPFVKEALIAIGFPDILLQPEKIFVQLLTRLSSSKADVILGLFPTNQPQKAGMVDFDAKRKVHRIIEKPLQTDLRYMWGVAVWKPGFTHFMHEYLAVIEADKFQGAACQYPTEQRELPLGDVIQVAIERGMHVEAEVFAEGEYLDIGTPEDLVRAVQKFSQPEIFKTSTVEPAKPQIE